MAEAHSLSKTSAARVDWRGIIWIALAAALLEASRQTSTIADQRQKRPAR